DADLAGSVQFFVGPGKLGDVAKTQFMWFLLHDQIHHRGQFSIYLRIAGGKVPSIYGPTADEPWT
ncbi:MAG TPA: DinB family protein, partial [Longimicrobium sp.]|nr:DinB family protein [Longimicrobium sp.]